MVLEAACRAVEHAIAVGADQCDVFVQSYSESSVTVRRFDVEKLIEAGGHSLGLRVIHGGRTAICSTSEFEDDSLEKIARQAFELVQVAAVDPYAGLPDSADVTTPSVDGLQLYDESLRSMSVESKITIAQSCEEAAFAEDDRVSNSNGATLATRAGEVAVANSNGFAASYPGTSISLTVEVMADDDEGKKRNAYWFSSERFLHRLDGPEHVGRTAARRAVAQLGARKVETGSFPVVFEPATSVDLLRLLSGCVSGESLYRGASFLVQSADQKVGSPLVDIADDPRLPGRGGSRPFDGEGVTTSARKLFDKGVFKGFLFDSYTARRAGARTTGSAHRGPQTLPSPGASNVVWSPGDSPPGEVVAGIGEGLFVTSLMGFGFNPTTGDFSRGAGGFWIKDGELAFPVAEINISGRMDEMLMAVDAVGDDLTWFGTSAAPTIRVAEMTVSGL